MRTEEQKRKRRENYGEVERKQHRAWRAANPGKCRDYERRARERHPEKVYKSNLQYNYGMTLDEYNALAAKQNFCCGICDSEKSGSKRCDKLFVDHCHDTEKVRGLLCMKCNMALGVFQSLELLDNAISYLEEPFEINWHDMKKAIQPIGCK